MLRSLVLSSFTFCLFFNPAYGQEEGSSCTFQGVRTFIDSSKEITTRTIENLYEKEFEKSSKKQGKESNRTNFYIFVSLSMNQKGLIDLGQQASHYGGVLVLRGLKENSYTKTALHLKEFIEKTGTGMIIDPELFKRFNVKTVPTFVLTEQSSFNSFDVKHYDTLQGFVSPHKALELIKEKGDLSSKANELLQKEKA